MSSVIRTPEGPVRRWIVRFTHAFLPPDHPALRNPDTRTQIRVFTLVAGTAGVVFSFWAFLIWDMHPAHALTYLAHVVVIFVLIAILIATQARYLVELIILLVFFSWFMTLIRAALASGVPTTEGPYVVMLVLAVHLLLGRWISLISLFFQVAALTVVDVIQGGLSTADLLNFSAHFRFYVHLTFAGVGVWLLSEGYSNVRDEIEMRLRAARADQAHDMELARNIQIELLPAPQTTGSWCFSGLMRTAMRVGGDYYDHIPAGGYDWFAIGDVTGHGLQAGMLALQARTLLRRALTYSPAAEPREIVTEVNAAFCEGVAPLRQRIFMTFCLLRCDVHGGVLYAGAHLPILVLRPAGRDLDTFQTPGPWLGLEPLAGPSSVPQSSITLKAGEAIFLFTDGASEAARNEADHLGVKRLGAFWKKAMLAGRTGDTLSAINKSVFAEILNFTGKTDLDDDLSLLTIEKN